MLLPAVTGSGASLLVTDKSVDGTIVVDSLAELLSTTGSVVAAETLAVLVTVALTDGKVVTLMVTVVLPPAARVPKPQVMVPTSSVQVGDPGADDTKMTPAGNVSVSV